MKFLKILKKRTIKQLMKNKREGDIFKKEKKKRNKCKYNFSNQITRAELGPSSVPAKFSALLRNVVHGQGKNSAAVSICLINLFRHWRKDYFDGKQYFHFCILVNYLRTPPDHVGAYICMSKIHG